MSRRQIKVLVVDDSLLFREMIARGLSSDPAFDVVGTAGDPFEASSKIEKLDPDVLSLDVEMPKMNGIEFTRRLMPQHPLPIVVVSAVSANVFDAMAAGAVDFVTKPGSKTPGGMDRLVRELSVKLKIAAAARLPVRKAVQPGSRKTAGRTCSQCRLIAIGASTGGTEAIGTVLKALPEGQPPVVIVQHMPPVFTRLFAERLDTTTKHRVVEAADGMVLEDGTVYIAPGGKHLLVSRDRGRLVARCIEGDKVSGHCPSVDMLFDSIGDLGSESSRMIAILLTGMGKDGAEGLLKLRKAGSLTICQDEASCVVFGMPGKAVSIGAANVVLPLERIHEPVLATREEV